jgi:hypothetical protein
MATDKIETEEIRITKDDIEGRTGQSFLSCVKQSDIETGEYPAFSVVAERIRTFFRQKNAPDLPMKLGLALAKYDYNGAPENWNDRHEEVIFEWVEWCLENYDAWKDDIELVLDQYARDLIPNAFQLMIHYFC